MLVRPHSSAVSTSQIHVTARPEKSDQVERRTVALMHRTHDACNRPYAVGSRRIRPPFLFWPASRRHGISSLCRTQTLERRTCMSPAHALSRWSKQDTPRLAEMGGTTRSLVPSGCLAGVLEGRIVPELDLPGRWSLKSHAQCSHSLAHQSVRFWLLAAAASRCLAGLVAEVRWKTSLDLARAVNSWIPVNVGVSHFT
ncbi:uncharacterized protein LY79DRAFT_657337 [Colletotrichum navitas]|uniref:Uncharacterized protein n=1 Tax=Colletotrichum navitas TaxID=681940 RepID=A0AAD8Q6F6_9PEZI|nr:uncharacterized protein LY79DRAFT_657337 [Colletotrichum navitas]KAK1595977.1 hypothetical protein LY79DRAFT_657337 [Colletotrichum navitas]